MVELFFSASLIRLPLVSPIKQLNLDNDNLLAKAEDGKNKTLVLYQRKRGNIQLRIQPTDWINL
jgi:hypothetical protein